MLAKLKKKYIGDWDFYKKYLLLAIPMILQNAITNLVSFLDNIMVGQLGTEQMSGVAIVNQLIFVYNLAIFGAVSAASIFGAQYFGKGNHKGHMYSFRFKLYATLLVTGGAILLFLTKGSALISLYLTDTVGNGNYKNLKSMLMEKYGNFSSCVERFQNSYIRTDEDRMRAVHMGECMYKTNFSIAEGDITLSIDYEEWGKGFVVLKYQDKINSAIIREAAIEDL